MANKTQPTLANMGDDDLFTLDGLETSDLFMTVHVDPALKIDGVPHGYQLVFNQTVGFLTVLRRDIPVFPLTED